MAPQWQCQQWRGAHTQLQCCADRYQNASKCCAKLYSHAATAGGIEMPNRKCISSCSKENIKMNERRQDKKIAKGRIEDGDETERVGICSHGCVEFVLQTECRSVERNMIIKAHKVQRSEKRASQTGCNFEAQQRVYTLQMLRDIEQVSIGLIHNSFHVKCNPKIINTIIIIQKDKTQSFNVLSTLCE